MKFTVVSHACLYIEDEGVKLLIDPWVIGSCYWRSWWNFPKPDTNLIKSLKPTHIYLTHLHWDHFHAPSLSLFSRDTEVLCPKIPTRRMLRDLNTCGFSNIREIAHGEEITLGKKLRFSSFQFGIADDSAAVITDGKTTILDANDTKFFGAPLNQILKKFPNIDFVLRSHSSASGIPYCVDGYKKRFPNFRKQIEYVEEFTKFAVHVGARYAIPFASNLCFLHRETVAFNETGCSPNMVKNHFDNFNLKYKTQSECVLMPSGSTWDDEKGFSINPFDYSKKLEYVAKLQQRYSKTLDKQYAMEEATVANYESFERYFTNFIASIPFIVRKFINLTVMFRIKDPNGTHLWHLDVGKNRVRRCKEKTSARIIIETPALIINDCTQKKMFSVWTAGKRLRIQFTEKENPRNLGLFFHLLDLYELDALPLINNFAPRPLGVWLRRWREAFELFKMIFGRLFGKKFSLVDSYPVPAN